MESLICGFKFFQILSTYVPLLLQTPDYRIQELGLQHTFTVGLNCSFQVLNRLNSVMEK